MTRATLPQIVRWLMLALVVARAPLAFADRALSLSDAVALAKMRRSEVAQAEIDVRRARLNVLRAWLERVRLTVQANFTEQAQQLNTFGPAGVCTTTPSVCAIEAHPFTATAALTVPLWSGLRLEGDLAGAKARQEAAAATKRATLNDVAADAANTYWEVRRAELDRVVVQSSLDRTRAIEQQARVRVEAKIAPSVDFERAHVQTMRQVQQLALLDSQLAVARAQLGLALQLDDDVRLTEDPAQHMPSPVSLPDALADAQKTRGELAAGAAVVEGDRQAVRSAKSAYWPQLSLVAQASASNEYFYFPPAPQQEQVVLSAFAGLQVSWLIFDMLATWTAVRDAGYQRDRDAAALERERYQVRADVRAAQGKLTTALTRRRAAAEAAESARRALFLLQKRYQVGDALLVEVLLGQQDVTQSEGDLNDATIDAAEAEAQFLAAVGRL
jgi:outer membrane protein